MPVRPVSVITLLVLVSAVSLQAATPKAKKGSTAAKPAAKSAATKKLLAAAAAGDADAILAAVAAGADANARDGERNTPLILAAPQSLFSKERKIVEALVAAKGQVDAVNKDGMTALMSASANGRHDFARLLLQNDAKADLRDNDGWTALMYAALNGQWDIVQELIEANADINATEKKGWSALTMAIFDGRGSVAEKLLKAGATLPAKAPNGMTPVLLAAYGRDLAALRLVLAMEGQPLDGRDSDDWTALEVAAYDGDGQNVMELLRAGADPSLKDKEGKTALDRAKENLNMEIVAILGGPWEVTKPKGGTTVPIPCTALGGKVEANFTVDGTALVVTTLFPKPVTWYLGGGNTNRATSSKQYTYEGSFAPAYFFDTDSNPKTGVKEGFFKESIGSEYSLAYSLYGTSVTLQTKDSQGNVKSKSVYANILSPDLEKEGQTLETSDVGEDLIPRATNENGVLITRIPLSLFKLTPGKTIRVTAKVGACGEGVVGKVKL
jgi:ankyrin repeat protein